MQVSLFHAPAYVVFVVQVVFLSLIMVVFLYPSWLFSSKAKVEFLTAKLIIF